MIVDETIWRCFLSAEARASAEGAATDNRKRRHYSELEGRYRSEPVAVETTGVIGKSSTMILYELGCRISAATGHIKETSWILQKISVFIARGNTASILATGGKSIWNAFNYVYLVLMWWKLSDIFCLIKIYATSKKKDVESIIKTKSNILFALPIDFYLTKYYIHLQICISYP